MDAQPSHPGAPKCILSDNSLTGNTLHILYIQAILHGPFNPYELKCHSLTRISKFRYD